MAIERIPPRRPGFAQGGIPRRFLAAALLVPWLVGGCSSVARMPLDECLPAPTRDTRPPDPQDIEGYTGQDGTYHEFHGSLVAFSPDSLRFIPPAPAWGGGPSNGDEFQKSRSEVTTILVKKGDATKTLALTVGVLAGAFLGLVALVAASGGVGTSW